MTPTPESTAADSPALAATDTAAPRLVWAPDDGTGRLAGAWWPRSRDADAELRALLPAVNEHVGATANRVSLNLDSWSQDQPRRLRLPDGLVRLGWFRTLDPATITIGRGVADRLTFVVIPSDWTDATGDAMLRRLSDAQQWPDDAGEALNGDALVEPAGQRG